MDGLEPSVANGENGDRNPSAHEQELVAEIRRLGEKLDTLAAADESRAAELRAALTAAENDLVETGRRAEEAEARLAALQNEIRQARADRQAMESERDELSAGMAAKLVELERAVHEKEHYVVGAEKRFGELADKIARQAQRLQAMENAWREAQAEAENARRALTERLAEADRLRGDLQKTQRQARDLAGEAGQLRRQTGWQERRLADFIGDSGLKRWRRLHWRLRRWLWQLPALGLLFAVNLITNVYMKRYEKRAGVKVFPGT